jgi:hypothetical protein
MLDTKYIAFASYPPRSDTSHDGGLVGLKSLKMLLRRQRLNGMLIVCHFFYMYKFAGSVPHPILM